MKFFEGFWLILAFITLIGIFNFPLIVSLITLNWWLMFLYFVSWIPTIGFMVFVKALMD